jgi:hypothetical protein
MNDARASFQRLLKYVIPVFSFATIFNIPKFFEAEVIYDEDGEIQLTVTELRKNPYYATYYSSWARLIVTGIIPFMLLVWFNTKIYRDIQVKRFFYVEIIITQLNKKYYNIPEGANIFET